MCNDYQLATITRLIDGVPSGQHHIIMDLVLRNQVDAAENVSVELAKAATLQEDTMQAFLIAQEETKDAVEHQAQASRNFVVARAEASALTEQLEASKYEYHCLSEMNAAFQTRVMQMETEIASLHYLLSAASDALDSAEIATALAIELVDSVPTSN
ncbi:hypothetical protein ACSFE6_04785 [Pseudomonas baetica]|uniref:hypothetical protein n=1 Tax=Pseudomonas baetica TaxID=674054 RepID=UPI003EEB204B